MTEKRFTVHIRWFNYEKTEGDIELRDNGQTLLMSESVEDVQYIKTLLNELHEENKKCKEYNGILYANHTKTDRELVKQISELKQENEQLKSSDTITDLETEIMKLKQENEQLKAQLLYDGDDVCGICKHEYLVPSGDYFIGKCKKGHKECSKEDIKYCEDFEKELKE